MASPEVTVAQAFVAAINTNDIAAMSKLMTDDHTFIDSGGTTVSGRETIVAGWQQYWTMFPDFRIRIDTVLQEGSVVALFGSWTATYAGGHGLVPENAVGGPAAWKAIIDHDRVKRWQVYTDHTNTAEVMQRDAGCDAARQP